MTGRHLFAGVCALAATCSVWAQNYPTKPIRFITSGVGGGGDFASRHIGQGISGPLGVQIIVDNRGGGINPMAFAVKADPDGYNVLVSGTSLWLAPLTRKVPYDLEKDFVPMSIIGTTPYLLFTHPSVPIKSVKELIALAKARPGVLNATVSSIGGGNHLALEYFNSMAGVKIVAIPYTSTGSEVQDLLGGRVEMTFTNPISLMDQVKLGKVRALAVASLKPSALAPGVPTFATSGLPGYEWAQSVVMVAPAKSPAGAIGRLNSEVVRYLQTPKAKEVFLTSGVETVGSSPEELATMMKTEAARVGKLIREAGIKVE